MAVPVESVRRLNLRVIATIACGAALLTLSIPGFAQQAGNGDWQYEITPYVWAAGLDGTARVNNRPQAGISIQQDFSDVLERLDAALMGAFEARRGRWGLLLDGLYLKVSDSGSVSGPLGFTSIAARGKVTQQMYAAAVSYRTREGRSPVDVLAGIRYNSIEWDVAIQSSVPALPGRQFTQKKDWADAYVGARIVHPISERWALMGYADIGAGGSDLTWQTLAGASYDFTERVSGKIGYRHLSIDYDKSDFSYDMDTGGVYVGIGIRF